MAEMVATSRRIRTYSSEEKAEALLAVEVNRGNVAAAALEVGIPVRTLNYWARGKGLHPEVASLVAEKRGPLADRLEQIAHLIAEGMDDPEKIAKAPLNQLSVALGVLIDKVRLLRGESPSGTPGHPGVPGVREVPQSVLIVLDPNAPEGRVASEVARLGLRQPKDFGAIPSPPQLQPTNDTPSG